MALPTLQQAPWSNNVNTGVTTQTATAGSVSVAGDIIIFTVEWEATNQTFTVADNANGGTNLYTLVQNGQSNSGNNTAVLIATNIRIPASGNLAITVTYSGSSAHNLITAIELTGVSTYNGVDLLGNISVLIAPATTTPSSNINLLSNLEFLVAAIHSDASTTLTARSGWTAAATNANNGKGVFYSTNTGTAPLSLTASPCTGTAAETSLLIVVAFAFSAPAAATAPVAVATQTGHYLPQGLLSLQPFKGSLYSDQAWIGQIAADPGWLFSGITGYKLRVHWNDVQPNDAADYDWAFLDAMFQFANQTGKIIGINLVMGVASPAWVFAAGSSQFTFTGFSTPAPPPWDVVFQGILTTFFQAMMARYGANPLFSYLELTGMGRGNQAGDWCQSNADNAELLAVATANGYSTIDSGVAIWVGGTERIGAIFNTIFAALSVIFTKGGPVFQNDPTGYFTALNSLLLQYDEFGLKDNALNASYNIGGQQQMAGYIERYSVTNPAGMQRDQPAVLASEWLASMSVALNLGAWFVEIYPSEETLIGNTELAIINQEFIARTLQKNKLSFINAVSGHSSSFGNMTFPFNRK